MVSAIGRCACLLSIVFILFCGTAAANSLSIEINANADDVAGVVEHDSQAFGAVLNLGGGILFSEKDYTIGNLRFALKDEVFTPALIFSVLWLIIVYVPITHWVWGGGWLGQMGLFDFAGGVVVHITAGVAALVAAVVLGPRRGFPSTAMPPHNMTMTITGAGMLWVGWYGFNGGSALAADGSAAMAMLVTHISASVGAMTWMFIEWKRFGKPSALGAVTGMVAVWAPSPRRLDLSGPVVHLSLGCLRVVSVSPRPSISSAY